MSLFTIVLLICYANLETTQSNYTQLVSSACNTSNPYYDSCACNLANYTANTDNLQCFNGFSCSYNPESNTFCSGHGYCDFTDNACVCDREYGNADCGTKYTIFRPNTAILITMMTVASLLLLFTLLLIVWVYAYKDVGDVKAMSVVFSYLTLVGCALICAGTIVMGIGFDNANCVILEWLHFLGICIVISCALLKSYRIAAIFSQSTFSASDLTDSMLLKYFFAMVAIDVFFLGIYTIFNFVEGGAYTRYIDTDLSKQVRCSSEPLTMLSYSLLVAWQLVLLLFVIKYGNQTRSASKIFKETKCIYVGSNIGSMFFIAFGIFVLFTTNYTVQIVIRGYGTIFVVCMVIGLLFYPKFKSVYNLRNREKHKLKIDEKEADLKRRYEAQVKEPNGKELLLLLDSLVKEIAYRAEMKMLHIELDSVDLQRCTDLIESIKQFLPQNQEQKLEKMKPKMENSAQSTDTTKTAHQIATSQSENIQVLMNMFDEIFVENHDDENDQ